MGDRTLTVMKARQELEELYGGVPDESVDLTFKDFASMQVEADKKVISVDTIHEDTQQGMMNTTPPHYRRLDEELYRESLLVVMVERSSTTLGNRQGGRRTKGPGIIPHTNVCALCNIYIYFFRHRCLVCGRVYCGKCVVMGMGTMTEGRKCLHCLGRRFSQRYIQRAGNTGCCWRCPNSVKQQELIWAEKGPRRSAERQPARLTTASTAINTEIPRTSTRPVSSMVP